MISKFEKKSEVFHLTFLTKNKNEDNLDIKIYAQKQPTKVLFNQKNHGFCIQSRFGDIGKQRSEIVKIAFFSKVFLKRCMNSNLLKSFFFRQECSLGCAAVFRESMVSLSTIKK